MNHALRWLVVAGLAGGSSAIAQPHVEFLTDVDSAGLIGDPLNTIHQFTVAEDFIVGRIDWSGMLTGLVDGTWGSDAYALVTAPSGSSANIQLGQFGLIEPPGTTISENGSSGVLGGEASLGAWSVEFNEVFDEDPGVDAIWEEFSLALNERPPPPTLAGLSIGTMTNGMTVTGDTSASSDDLDGPNGVGNGSWSGGDDVWTLDWNGGRATIDLSFIHAIGDLDLSLFDANEDLIESSLSVSNNEQIVAALDPGTYYLVIDGWQGATNDYSLGVVPAPATALLIGALAWRRRRPCP